MACSGKKGKKELSKYMVEKSDLRKKESEPNNVLNPVVTLTKGGFPWLEKILYCGSVTKVEENTPCDRAVKNLRSQYTLVLNLIHEIARIADNDCIFLKKNMSLHRPSRAHNSSYFLVRSCWNIAEVPTPSNILTRKQDSELQET